MDITIFTNGVAGYSKNADGEDVLRIEFGVHKPKVVQRHAIAAHTRLETNGAIAKSFGRGNIVLENASLDDLQVMFSDEKIFSEVSGSSWLGYDDLGFAQCD